MFKTWNFDLNVRTASSSGRIYSVNPKSFGQRMPTVTRMTVAACLAVGLGICTSGCGTGLFGPKIYTTPTGADQAEVIESPLPPLKLEVSLSNPKEQVLYGRVVVNGKPAKKGSVVIVVLADEALKDPENASQYMPGAVARQGKPSKHSLKPVSSAVLQDDGLYSIKGIRPGEYRVYCKFGTAFKGKESQTLRYSTPFETPFKVDMGKGQQMLDIVMEIDTPSP